MPAHALLPLLWYHFWYVLNEIIPSDAFIRPDFCVFWV